MLSDEIFLLVNAIIKGTDTKVIFMGDQAQIPPVGKDDALPLIEHKEQGEFILSIYREEIENEKTKKPMVKFHKRAYPINQEIRQTLIFEDGMFMHEAELLVNIPYYTLTQSMRQKADSGILKTANSIRDHRWFYDNAIMDRQQMHDLFFYSSSSPIDKLSFMSEMFKLFKSDIFAKDSDYVKVLAWRNKTVDGLSTVIRKQIFKGQRLQKFMIGEKLIASNPIIQGSNIVFNTSDEFTITDMKIDRETYEYPLTEEQKNKKLDNEIQETLGDTLTIKDTGTTKDTELAFWSLSVKSTLPNEEDEDIIIEEIIKVLHESSDKAYKKLLSRYAYIEDWKGWGKLKDTYANVAYNYCITVHKAQGSSYKNVFVVEDDIDANFKVLEKNRIKYTAVSRASETLHILTRHI
jgi:exodeoxyribonuclease-5